MSQSNEQQTPVDGLYVGEIRLLPFRHDELPAGWHFCNGERFLLTSPQGEALSGLSENFRADWGLEEDLCSISLPNLFHEDGRGCFLRPVDGLTRQVGASQEDAIRNITGGRRNYAGPTAADGYGAVGGGSASNQPEKCATGAFKLGEATRKGPGFVNTPGCVSAFDASLAAPAAEENRPLNLGMTPAIYLGV